ncbi:MAG TPA: hypothetical protein VFW98_06410 [Gemmatimonadaceae bacterium]|nr:hypothetical protein [Gemmatimonadaceae bacterium]
MRASWFRASLITLAALSATACIWIFRGVKVAPVDPSADSTAITSPVKAHLVDGTTIVYAHGVVIARDTVRGVGARFDITGNSTTVAERVPLDSVVAMEDLLPVVHAGPTVAVSTFTTAIGVVAAAGLAVAIFGSCPTVYSDSAGTPVMEGEAFSYSIAPLFERRDVFRLRAQPDARGVLSLEVRNEALETHYINHLQLLEVRHGADEVVMPDAAGHPLALSGIMHPARIADRSGHDLRPILAGDDSLVFRTDSGTIANASLPDLDDYIDLAMPAPRGADSVAVVFNLRNSLLNTVLLYDVVLGPQGAHAIDWLAGDLSRIGNAVAMGRWYGSRMGMHIAVWRNGRYEPAAYVPDAGPIAWRRVAAVVPVPPLDTLRLRLTFIADQWRIGSLAIATRMRRPTPRVIALSGVRSSDVAADSAAERNLHDSDERYLVTSSGQRFTARFDTGRPTADSSRTFLLASQGYYLEWIRRDWIRAARGHQSFAPSDSALLTGLREWGRVHEDFERRFENTRIPVR